MTSANFIGQNMKLVFSDATAFKKAVDAIAILIDEAEFVITETGLTLKATDPSQISMIDFSLGREAFKEYNISEPAKIGLDLEYLSGILGRAKSGDELTISMDEKQARLEVLLKGASARKFSIPLLDISSQELPNPKIEFDAELKVRADILQDALKDASLIGSHITLGADADKFFVKASSSKGELNNETPKTDKAIVQEFSVKKECSAMFPLDYLQYMLKAADSSTIAGINIKASAPIKIAYKIGSANICYYLAPRIEG